METLEAYVLMPYGGQGEYEGAVEESDYVFNEIIDPGIRLAAPSPEGSLRVRREVNRSRGGSITAALVRSIVKADVVVVDITGQNANVFLELGMRYALRSRVTILLAQDGTEIPFDIKGYRYIRYSKYRPAEAREKLAAFVRQGLEGRYHSDSVVFDVFTDMSVLIPGTGESHGENAAGRSDVMPWEEYMRRIDYICDFLRPPISEGHFIPDAVLGISNGGLIVADLIGKQLFAGGATPILALWAHRTAHSREKVSWFFENDYNKVTVENLKTIAARRHGDEDCTVLLVDDHTGSGQTANQAISYLLSRLGERTKVVFTPLVSRRLKYIEVVGEYLPYSLREDDGRQVFSVGREEYLQFLGTGYAYFPYLQKEIRAGTGGD